MVGRPGRDLRLDYEQPRCKEIARIPACRSPRLTSDAEVSNLVVYLASDESSYSTGSEFAVDGGCTAGVGHKDFSAVQTDQQPEWIT